MRNIIVILLVLLFATSHLQARDYSYPALDVTIWLQTDGSMLVQEDRSFRFWGRYSEGFRSFPTEGMAAPDIMAEDPRPKKNLISMPRCYLTKNRP